MNIFEYFGSSPEAVATLLVFAIGGTFSAIALLYNILKKRDVAVFHRETRSLFSIDSALQEYITAEFIRGQEKREIHELTQVELEIANNDLRQEQDCQLTINLKSSKASILGVSAANSDNRIPRLGGRKVTGRIEKVPLQPSDPLFRPHSQETFPAIVLDIPSLQRRQDNNRVFLRITYDGPRLEPGIQGARLVSSSANPTAIILLLLAVTSLVALVLTPPHLQGKIEAPFALLALVVSLLSFNLFADTSWLSKWLRPINQLIRPLPTAVDTLAEFHFYNALDEPQPLADNEQSQDTPQAKVPTPTTTKPAIEGELVIRKATFGAEDRQKDVTDIVQSKMSEGKLEIPATINILGDPAPGTGKKLILEYTYRGQRHTSETDENQTLSLP